MIKVEINAKTKSQIAAADVAGLLKARATLIWIVTGEEARVEGHLFEAAKTVKMVARTWDVAQGAATADGVPSEDGDRDPGGMLNIIGERARNGGERGVWVMRDLPVWLAGPSNAPTLRALRNLSRSLQVAPVASMQAVIVLSPSKEVPPELINHVTVIEWPMPDRAEIESILDEALLGIPEDMRAAAAPNGTRDKAIDAALGLSGAEALACYRRSLVQLRKIDPVTVAGEKKRIIARDGLLEWFDPLAGGLDAVGGLDLLKGWLKSRASAFTARARAYGLPAPKGLLLVGVPGCGKTLTAKAVATAYGMPLLRADLGALKGKFVGESEANLRRMLRIAETCAPCVLWLDEIEKSLAGATSPGGSDGGVSADALGTILSWMQDRTAPVFVIATANDVTSLPPELLRKGRFDDVFAIDLPTEIERTAILVSSLKQAGRALDFAGCASIAKASDGFTGSEVAALVPEAMFAAFADGEREITSDDLLAVAKTVTPLSKTAAEKIAKLREWAKGRARPASSTQIVAQASGIRLDI